MATDTTPSMDTDTAPGMDTDTTPEKRFEWQKVAEIADDDYKNSIAFVDETHGWIVGFDGGIYHSDDGGFSWNLQWNASLVDLNAVVFVNRSVGWAVGDSSAVLNTVNGGDTWKFQMADLENERSSYLDIFFLDEHIGWVCGNQPSILYTTDGGENWHQGNIDTYSTIIDIHFIDEQEGYAVGSSLELLHTVDGGINWTTHDLSDLDYSGLVTFHSLYFSSRDRGWIGLRGVGTTSFYENGLPSLYTDDGGESWLLMPPSYPGDMGIEFEFADSEVGWMMSWSFILATRDGGATWHPQLDPENLNLNLIDLSSPDRDHAWALGFSGQIYKLVEVL